MQLWLDKRFEGVGAVISICRHVCCTYFDARGLLVYGLGTSDMMPQLRVPTYHAKSFRPTVHRVRLIRRHAQVRGSQA
jgi:hypothetical protein